MSVGPGGKRERKKAQLGYKRDILMRQRRKRWQERSGGGENELRGGRKICRYIIDAERERVDTESMIVFF